MLALQGDFREHLAVLGELGADAVPVRRESELDDVDGLVIPGGESSVMDKLSRAFGLAEPLKARIAAGMPVYGTCAGLIMLADTRARRHRGAADVRRAGYRRCAATRSAPSTTRSRPISTCRCSAIRPCTRCSSARRSSRPSGRASTALAALADGRVVAVEQGNLLGTSFHPEITDDYRFHSASSTACARCALTRAPDPRPAGARIGRVDPMTVYSDFAGRRAARSRRCAPVGASSSASIGVVQRFDILAARRGRGGRWRMPATGSAGR